MWLDRMNNDPPCYVVHVTTLEITVYLIWVLSLYRFFRSCHYTDYLELPPSTLSHTAFHPFMEEKCLHHPLLPLASLAVTTETTSYTTSFVGLASNGENKIIASKFGVSIRLFSIILIGFISVWANHEASKGFVITVTNNMEDTQAGKNFDLFFVSNDEAIRLVQSSTNFAAKILFTSDNSIPEKLIDQVEVQLASHNLTNGRVVAVKSFGQQSKYVLSINPLVMEAGNFKYNIRKELQRGVAEILLFNQRHKAPMSLLDGMVEYINDLAGFGGPKPVFKLRDSSEKCWEDKDPRVVAEVLAYCEGKRKGFVGGLNQEMNRDEWYEKMMDQVLGTPAIHLCEEFHNSMSESADMMY